jgi:ABC-type dipeptide/oligopeptide/nickel transport system permease component
VRPFASPFVYIALGLIQLALGLWLSYLLAYKAELFPISGYCDLFSSPGSDCSGPREWAWPLTLPSITLGLVVAAIYAVVVRGLADGVARAAALPAGQREDTVQAARRHARVAFLKLVSRNWFWLIGATLWVEITFNLGGLAQYFLDDVSYSRSNPPVAEAILILTTLITVGGWLVVDLVGAAISREWREL